MGEVCILDLDISQGEKRFIKIAGEKIYISKVPAMTTMLYDQIVTEGREIKTQEDAAKVMDKAARAVLITINYNREKKYTKEWLFERCEYAELTRIIAAMHEPLKKNIPEAKQADV